MEFVYLTIVGVPMLVFIFRIAIYEFQQGNENPLWGKFLAAFFLICCGIVLLINGLSNVEGLAALIGIVSLTIAALTAKKS